jgi:hypothetical protein
VKWVASIIIMGMSASGCYVRYPSIGVAAPRVHHVQKCEYMPNGKVACVNVRTWSK